MKPLTSAAGLFLLVVLGFWMAGSGSSAAPAQQNSKNFELLQAAQRGDTKRVQSLLDGGMNVNGKGYNESTALMYAAISGHVEMVTILLAHGANVDAQDSMGGTALMYAVWKGHTELVRILLAAGADVDKKGRDGRTALSVAEKGGRAEIIKLLKEPAAKRPEQSTDTYRTHRLESYAFEIPIDWEVGGRAEEQHMRGMLDVVPSHKITALSTFASGDGCVVTVYEIPLPAGEGDAYIDKLHSQNEEKFRIGRSRGLVKNVLENRKIRRATFDVLLLDWESNRGQLPHERQWVLHTKQLPNTIVIVTTSCNEQGFRAMKDAIDRVASSVTLNVRAPALYRDKNGYFSFVPPAGWIQKDYPTDPRSKVQFDCPGTREVLLRIIAEVASPGLSSDNVVEMVRERARIARSRLGSGLKMEVEQGTFSGVPAALTRQSISGQAQMEQEVTIFVAGTVMFNIAYSAPNRTMLEKYRAIAEESLRTLVVGQEALKSLDDETLRKHLVDLPPEN